MRLARWSSLVILPVLIAVGLLVPGAARAQQKPQQKPQEQPAAPPAFPAQVDLVTVDVVVTDKKGAPITGLTRESFTVLEDGQPQGIASFEAVVLPDKPSASPPPQPRIATNTATEARAGRSFLVVFDDVHLSPQQAHRAKGAVAEFLKNGVREGDVVTLAATSGSAWWSARMEAGREELLALTKRLDGRNIPDMSPERMSDYEAMRIHVYNDTQVEARVARRFETYGVGTSTGGRQSANTTEGSTIDGDPFVRGRAADVYFQAVAKNRITLDVVQRVLGSMAGTKGRKSLILVSEGFIYDPNLSEFRDVVQASRRANVAIYFLDTRGLSGMSVYATAQFGPALPEQDIGFAFTENIEASEGAESLAGDSGGFTVKNTNDLGRGIQRIADETRSYYLLGYNPTNTARDGRFRKIQVRLDRKNVEVRARKGYYAALEGAKAAERKPGAPDPVFQAALDSPFDVDQIPMRMTSYVMDEALMGKASVMVATEVDLRDFAFEEQEGRLVDSAEFLMVVAHRETGEFFRYDQKIDMRLLPETRARMARTWLPIQRDFELAPGGYQAKIVVRDKNSGRVGTVVHRFEVPELGPFRVSTPVITDTLRKQEGDNRPIPTMLARRSFLSGEMLFCQFDVYGAAKDTKSGMPKVSAGYKLLRPDGTPFTEVAPSPIQPTSLGRLSRIVGSRLEGAAPGEYELVLEVKDEISGKKLELREPLVVEPPA
jgi:VWFA-related protein